MTDRIDFLTPVGRIVGGDPFKANSTDATGRPLTIKTGPRAGEPRQEWFVALAIPKSDPGWPELYGKITQAARDGFPHLFDAQGNCSHPRFAFKVTDGDSQTPNSNGRRPCDREGYPGNWVVNCSTGIQPQCYSQGGAETLTDPASIKRGYYVRLYGSVVGNGAQQQPGVFVNFSMVELVAYGEEIKVGPDAAAVFGGSPAAALPPGASATPVTPAGPPIAQPGPTAAAPPVPPTPAAAPPPQPQPGVIRTGQPAPSNADFLRGPKTYAMPDGNQYTAEQLLAAGWTQAQIESLG